MILDVILVQINYKFYTYLIVIDIFIKLVLLIKIQFKSLFLLFIFSVDQCPQARELDLR
jgi:hypothetical protein